MVKDPIQKTLKYVPLPGLMCNNPGSIYIQIVMKQFYAVFRHNL